MLLLAAIFFLNFVNAGCSGAEIIRGRVHAICTDELTGFDFEYIDLDDTFLDAMVTLAIKSSAVSMRNLHANIYNHYDPVGVNSTTPAFDPSAIQQFPGYDKLWQNCKKQITAACTYKHAIEFGGFASDFISAAVALLAEFNTNKREAKNPRAVCHRRNEVSSLDSRRMCVSWSVIDYAELGADQLDAIAIGCEKECQELKMSCETMVLAGGVLQHLCLSDRASGCKLPLGNNFAMCAEE